MSGAFVPTGSRKSKGHRSLPYPEWPEADRAAWESLFREGDLLDDAGAALHWREATRRINRAHYGRWLNCLVSEGRPGQNGGDELPWERATPDAVEGYARALLAQVAPRTAATSLIGLKCVLQRMAPDADWAWLKRLTNHLDSWALPSRALRAPELPAPELFDRALAELDKLSRIPAPGARERLAYRDALLVGLLLAYPIRLRNLAQMEMDRHLVRLGPEWHLRFEP